MDYWHILYIDGRPVAEIEIRVEPFPGHYQPAKRVARSVDLELGRICV